MNTTASNEVEKHIFSIQFDSSVYSLKAVKNAAFDCSDKASFQIETVPSGKILVSIAPKLKDSEFIESFEMDFKSHVLDHQIRIEVSDEFKLIREIIVAQAFEPCDNLEEIIDTLSNEKN